MAIIGSRSCRGIDIGRFIDMKPSEIVSGGAAGADYYAREYALKHDIPLREFLPEYQKYGKTAPLIRNIKIVENCDCLIAFWNGKSRGTKFTLDLAIRNGKPFKVVRI